VVEEELAPSPDDVDVFPFVLPGLSWDMPPLGQYQGTRQLM
jgi:hypothetical protein